MAGNGLRVPITILHEKVYQTGRRLAPLVLLEVPKKEAPKISTKGGWQKRVYAGGLVEETTEHAVVIRDADTSDTDVLSKRIDQALAAVDGTQHPVFKTEAVEYLRRFFLVTPNQLQVVCRGCGALCPDTTSRIEHTACRAEVAEVLYQLQLKGMCVVCGKPADEARSSIYWSRVPLCSDGCLRQWDHRNPDKFRLQLTLYRNEQIAGSVDD